MSSDDEEPPPPSLLQQQQQQQLLQSNTTLTHGHSYLDAPLPSIQRMPLPPVVGSAGKDPSPRRHIQPQQRFRPYPNHHHPHPRNNNNNNSTLHLNHEQEPLLANKHTDKPASNNKVKEPDKQQLDLFGSIPESQTWSTCSMSSSLLESSNNNNNNNFHETVCDDETIFTEFAQLTADPSSPSFCFEHEFSSSSSNADDDFVLFP
ncbi:hypothetical protein BDB00DRAFT_838299 [Zychaea mexicana]|uniref:uncharacterized protein n=1 Tax=Zychaea mexicana TaxID=64656 RepID=UPI0022FE72CB|nr:uncharacterized protein BDB00DRAFT_838299 [Zychaea mexicana]KAI9490384.1 hypothetical protein BDB00DRAFT_838299 [Zychaea mexicana]